jgi:two-component system nitrogen regulation response regulator GlnG
MPAELQTRLLRVLADGVFYRVGGHSPIKVDVRVIAATHQNLEEYVKKGLFREDLFHRLNVIRIPLPALRERREDIPALLHLFLQRAINELEVEPKQLQADTVEYLSTLEWPGNVRQLENLCHWLAVMTSGKVIHLTDLPEELLSANVAVEHATSGNWKESLNAIVQKQLLAGDTEIAAAIISEVEEILIRATLEKTKGRKNDASKLLGWGRNTLTRKIKELDIQD